MIISIKLFDNKGHKPVYYHICKVQASGKSLCRETTVIDGHAFEMLHWLHSENIFYKRHLLLILTINAGIHFTQTQFIGIRGR